MAYRNFSEHVPALDHGGANPRAVTQRASFSPLEWSAIALARRDTLSSLRAPGPMSIAMGTLFGARPNPALADARLEALRRMAVLVRRDGRRVPLAELDRFHAAGFDHGHFALLSQSVARDRAKA